MSRPSGESARQVPDSTASSGITLSAVPAWNWVTLTTTLSSGSLVRLAMVWRAVTICAPTITGSTAWCGIAAWPPRPRMRIENMSAEAIIAPVRTPIRPRAMPGQLCMP